MFWLRMQAKIVDMHKAWHTAGYISSTPFDATGRVMARIQFDFVTMLVKKLVVGQTRSISIPILGWRDFRLTTSILYEKIGCL